MKVKLFYKGELLRDMDSLKVINEWGGSPMYVNTNSGVGGGWRKFTFVDRVSSEDTAYSERLYRRKLHRFVMEKYKVTWDENKELEFEIKVRRPWVLFRDVRWMFPIPIPFGLTKHVKLKFD